MGPEFGYNRTIMSDSSIAPLGITRLGLIAGEGQLPIHVAANATRQGTPVVAFSVGKDNRSTLKRLCKGHLHPITPGLMDRNLALFRQEGVSHIVFAGKVNKWILFRDPRLDRRALEALNRLRCKNDDRLMLGIIEELNQEGFQVVSQTDYLQNLFLPAGPLTQARPRDETDEADIRYGFSLAKEMGRLDVGQTVVVCNGMVLAIEAIEGTDECLRRAGKWGRKKGGVVVKVAKPEQDNRFDVPTVGLRTLKVMRSSGLHLLATEANRTLFLDAEAMIRYAEKHQMVITSVCETSWQ